MMSLLDLPGCVVFECVGVPGSSTPSSRGASAGTRIFSAGGPPQGDHVHTMVAKRKGLNIQFGGGPSMTHWNEAFEEVCSGRLDVAPMFGWSVDLEGVPTAIEDARGAHGSGADHCHARLIASGSWARARWAGPWSTGSVGRASTWPRSPGVPRSAPSSSDRGCTSSTTVAALARGRDVVVVYVYSDEQVREWSSTTAWSRPWSRARRSWSTPRQSAHGRGDRTSGRPVGCRGGGRPGERGPGQVADGTLTLFVGGDDDVVARCRPLFAAYATRGGALRRPRRRPEGEALEQPAVRAHVELAVEAAELCGAFGLDRRARRQDPQLVQRRRATPSSLSPHGIGRGRVEGAGRFVHKDVVARVRRRRRRRPTRGARSRLRRRPGQNPNGLTRARPRFHGIGHPGAGEWEVSAPRARHVEEGLRVCSSRSGCSGRSATCRK